MTDNLTNLLPPEHQRTFLRIYFMRLCTVFISFVITLTLIAIVLLLPTYVLLSSSLRGEEARLASFESNLDPTDGADISKRIYAISNNLKSLASLGSEPSVSAILRTALAVPHKGIYLSGFSYVPVIGVPPSQRPATLVISGIAKSRADLHEYEKALASAPFAVSTNLPVSTYAIENNIPFSITIILSK